MFGGKCELGGGADLSHYERCSVQIAVQVRVLVSSSYCFRSEEDDKDPTPTGARCCCEVGGGGLEVHTCRQVEL